MKLFLASVEINMKQKESARGEPCTMRLDKCIGGGMNETTVFCHKMEQVWV